jgi:hypothetical protein
LRAKRLRETRPEYPSKRAAAAGGVRPYYRLPVRPTPDQP